MGGLFGVVSKKDCVCDLFYGTDYHSHLETSRGGLALLNDNGLGYASTAELPFKRPFVKYTPTWPRSFMPQDQTVRDIVAKMKFIPIRDLIEGKRLLFCEDSIVRGTQLKDTIQRLEDLVKAIGLPKEKISTYCWGGAELK